MRPEELRLGDYVTFKDSLEDDTILKIKIIALGENETLVQIDGDDACDIIAIDDEIVGIPITPEILEKNGFEMESNGNYWFSDEDEGLEITFSPKEKNYTNGAYDYVDINKGCLSIIELPVSFVHELQHALRLCGIEKEIEL